VSTVAFDFGDTLTVGPRDPADERPVALSAAVVLRLVHGAGYRLALSSNVRPGCSRRSMLAAARLERRFTAIVESSAVGYRKPERQFYEALIRAAGVPAAEIVHVGNDLDEDVLVPIAMGMRAVHLSPHLLRPRLPAGAIRLDQLIDLLPLLNIAAPPWLRTELPESPVHPPVTRFLRAGEAASVLHTRPATVARWADRGWLTVSFSFSRAMRSYREDEIQTLARLLDGASATSANLSYLIQPAGPSNHARGADTGPVRWEDSDEA